MNTDDKGSSNDNTVISGREMLWRVSWIGVRLILVFALADEFQPFFYQAF